MKVFPSNVLLYMVYYCEMLIYYLLKINTLFDQYIELRLTKRVGVDVNTHYQCVHSLQGIFAC